MAAIEPRVIDAWLAYASVEPEAFDELRAESGEPRASGPLLDAVEAAKRMAQRL